MRDVADIINCTNARILDEELEVFMFKAERMDMDFSRTSIVRKNGHIISPRKFSTDGNLLNSLLLECRVRKIPVTIDARNSIKVIINNCSVTAESITEALVKCILIYLETSCH